MSDIKQQLKVINCKEEGFSIYVEKFDTYVNDIFHFYSEKRFVEKMALVKFLNLDSFEKFKEKIIKWIEESYGHVYFIIDTFKDMCIGIITFNIHLHNKKFLNVGFALDADYWGNGIVDFYLQGLEKKAISSPEFKECKKYLISCDKANKATKRIALSNGYDRSKEDDFHPRNPTTGELHLEVFLRAYLKDIEWK